MHKTVVNALVHDKGNIGIDPVIRDSLKTFYQRNTYVHCIPNNPLYLIIEEDIDECLKKAGDTACDYLILTWEGNMFDIHEYHHACIAHINKLDDETNGDWLVAGQIIDQYQNRILYNVKESVKWENSFYLFPITALINLKKWRALGFPTWGRESDHESVIKAIPSKDCVHDNYTPLNLLSSNETVNAKVKKGWNIIDVALKNNFTVHNLSNEIRNSQTYLYPENDVEKFNNFWNSLYLMPKLTDQYKKVLERLIHSKYPQRINNNTWQCFVKNTEDYFPRKRSQQFDWSTIDTIILPCSGFKDFIISMSKHSLRKPIEIVHFDIINQCVDIKKKIINLWDGRRETFSNTLEIIGKSHGRHGTDAYHLNNLENLEGAYDHMLEFFHDEEDLRQCWDQFKNFNHMYIEADMLDNPTNALDLINGKNVYICLSDIAGWRNNIVGYGYKNLRNNISNCITNILNKGITGIVDYKDPATDKQLWQEFNQAITYLALPPTYETQ